MSKEEYVRVPKKTIAELIKRMKKIDANCELIQKQLKGAGS